MKNLFFISLMMVLLSAPGCRKSNYSLPKTITLNDDSHSSGTITWKSDHEYLLDGLVFVNDGQTLIIEPGTVIKGKTGQGENASALIVARGGKIIAEGTAENPIIFTVEGDDLDGSVPGHAQGLWGGVIILGEAPITTESGEAYIEGVSLAEPRGLYGGRYPEDNSGVLKYVSIRHAGTNIGEGNEINGLTLGGVGSKTTLDYIEVIASADDGFEFFGGTVNGSHLVAAYCDDDAFDFDQGFSGNMQFLYGVQSTYRGDNLCEHDGLNQNAQPVIANATFIGRDTNGEEALITLHHQSAAKYYNNIFLHQSNGIYVDNFDIQLSASSQWLQGNTEIAANIFHNTGDDDSFIRFLITPDSELDNTLTNRVITNNIFQDPGIGLVDNRYNPIPAPNVHHDIKPLSGNGLIEVNYRGAFYDTDWTQQWTLTSQTGIE
jgi:hypothetical protein